MTPFQIACGRGNWPVVRFLLEGYYYDCILCEQFSLTMDQTENLVTGMINQSDNEGETPLHYACRYGHEEVVLLLLASKANPGALNKEGNGPAEVRRKYKASVEVVMEN